MLFAFPRARARVIPRPAVSIRAARSYGDSSARADRNRWPRGSVACVRSGISGWVIGLLIRGRAGAERARRIKENKATANQSPWLKLYEESDSKGTSKRRQLDCAKTL
jgi:hypothetical protein